MSVPQVWPCLPCVPQLSAVLWLPATLASQAQSVGPWSTRSSLPSLQSPLKVHYPSITLYQAVCSTHHTHPTHSGIFSSPPVLFFFMMFSITHYIIQCEFDCCLSLKSGDGLLSIVASPEPRKGSDT